MMVDEETSEEIDYWFIIFFVIYGGDKGIWIVCAVKVFSNYCFDLVYDFFYAFDNKINFG